MPTNFQKSRLHRSSDLQAIDFEWRPDRGLHALAEMRKKYLIEEQT